MFKEIEQVKTEIQEHEGFRDTIYSDSLGFATIGWGHPRKRQRQFWRRELLTVKKSYKKVFDEDFLI